MQGQMGYADLRFGDSTLAAGARRKDQASVCGHRAIARKTTLSVLCDTILIMAEW